MSFSIHHKSGKKITWSQVENGIQMNERKIPLRDAERGVREHLDGANTQERRQVYEQAFGKRDK